MIRETAFIAVIMFTIGLFFVMGYFMFDTLNSSFQSIDSLPSSAKNTLNQVNDGFPSTYDWGFFTIFMGLMLALLAILYVLDINPFVFFIILILVAVVGLLAGYLSNAWYEATETGALAASADQFPLTDFILTYYMHIILVWALMAVTVFFVKPPGGVL